MKRTFTSFDDVGMAVRDLDDRLQRLAGISPTGSSVQSGKDPLTNAPGSTALTIGANFAKLNQAQFFTGLQTFKGGILIPSGGVNSISFTGSIIKLSGAGGRFVQLSSSGDITGQSAGTATFTITGSGIILNSGGGISYAFESLNDLGSQLHLSDGVVDDGGYLSGFTAGAGTLWSYNAAWNGTNWIAKAITAVLIALDPTNGFTYYYDTGLTIGNAFTPTLRFKINGTGDITKVNSIDNTTVYKVGGTQVVGARGASVADVSLVTTETAGAAYTATEQSMLNHLKTDVTSLKTQLNLAFARLRSSTGHGLWT